jgi:hypothetical protein
VVVGPRSLAADAEAEQARLAAGQEGCRRGWGLELPPPPIVLLSGSEQNNVDLMRRLMVCVESEAGVHEPRGGQIASHDHPLRVWDGGEGEVPLGGVPIV